MAYPKCINQALIKIEFCHFWKGNGRMFDLVCDTPMILRKIVTVQLTIGVNVMDTRGCATVGITHKKKPCVYYC